MFVGDVAAETLHKAPASLFCPPLMKWMPLRFIDRSELSQPIADDPYQGTARAAAALAPPLHCDLLHNLL